MDFQVGLKFQTYSALENAIKEFSRMENVHLYKKCSRTIENYSKYCRSDEMKNMTQEKKEDLKYQTIKYVCVHGDPDHTTNKKKGLRQSRSRRIGCPFFMLFSLDKDAMNLQLMKMNSFHNHEVNEILFKMHPRERRLPEDLKRQAEELMKLQVNKKLLQSKLMRETGKIILLKDLSNIAASKSNPKNVESCIKLLQDDYKCRVNVLHQDNVLQGIFFQDEKMAAAYDKYPEVLFVDGTYKLLNIRFVCFIFLTEDGNGNSEIVGVGLLAREDSSSLDWLIQSFKDQNSAWPKTRVIMTDKDMTERKLFRQKFPTAELLLCTFHVLQAFRRQVTSEKFNISKEKLNFIREFLTKLCYVNTEDQYWDLYAQFSLLAPEAVLSYYNKNWHPIYKEWTHISSLSGNFLNFTNNRIESLNAKLKSVIKPFSSLDAFIKNFFVILESLRKERDYNVANSVLKISAHENISEDSLAEYREVLLPYPFEYLFKQYKGIKPGLLLEEAPANFSYESRGKLYPVNAFACGCSFFNSMRLPCKHVLAVRKAMNVQLFDESLFDKRWTKKYILENQRVFTSDPFNSEISVVIREKRDVRPKTAQEKYRTAETLTKELASIASESCGDDFDCKIKLIKDIIEFWKNGKKISLLTSDPEVSSIENQNGLHLVQDNSSEVNLLAEEDENSYSVMQPTVSSFLSTHSVDEGENDCSVSQSIYSGSVATFSADEGENKLSISPAGYSDSEAMFSYNEDENDHLISPSKCSDSDATLSADEDESNIPLSEFSTFEHEVMPITDQDENEYLISVPNCSDSDATMSADEDQIDISPSGFSSFDHEVMSVSDEDPIHGNILSQISFPPILKKRGRSRGFDRTVIGVKKKKTSANRRPAH